MDQDLPTNNTRMIREYGADLGGPIIKDKLWLWFAGVLPDDLDEPGDLQLDPSASFSSPETTNLEPWSAKLNWQLSNANSAQLYYQRSDRTQVKAGRRADRARPRRRRNSRSRPTSTRSRIRNVFSSDLFASFFANYQQPDYTDARQRLARLR